MGWLVIGTMADSHMGVVDLIWWKKWDYWLVANIMVMATMLAVFKGQIHNHFKSDSKNLKQEKHSYLVMWLNDWFICSDTEYLTTEWVYSMNLHHRPWDNCKNNMHESIGSKPIEKKCYVEWLVWRRLSEHSNEEDVIINFVLNKEDEGSVTSELDDGCWVGRQTH